MKNKALVLFLTACLLSLSPRPIYAQTPSPAALQKVKTMEGVAVSQRMDLSQTSQFAIRLTQGWQPALNFLLNFIGHIKPSGDKLSVFDFDKTAKMFLGADKALTPKQLQDLTKDFDPKIYQLRVSGKSRLCVVDPVTKEVVTTQSNDPYLSDPIPELNLLDQYGQRFGSYWTGLQRDDQDYRQSIQEIGNDLPGCGTAESAENQRSRTVNSSGQNSFGAPRYTFFNTIQALIDQAGGLLQLVSGIGDSLTANAYALVFQQVPYANEIKCLVAGGCGANKGGVALTFAPASHDPSAGKTNGEQQNSFEKVFSPSQTQNVQTRTAQTKAIENSGDYIRCMILPKTLQGPECQQNWQKNGAGSESCKATQMPDLASSGCELCHSDNLYNVSSLLKATMPEGVPPTMKKILEKAGATYHVPPYSLLAAMFHESGLFPQDLQGYTWTEENVQKWSFCGETMPFCKPTDVAALPFGMQPGTFNHYKDAVSDVYPERKGNENICNFMDQAFAAAKLLSVGLQSKLSEYITTDCFGATVSQLQARSTPTSCSWSEFQVFRSHLQYAGYCPQTGKNAGFRIVNDQYRNWIDLFWDNFKCD